MEEAHEEEIQTQAQWCSLAVLLEKWRQDDHLSPGVQDQPGQHHGTLLKKEVKGMTEHFGGCHSKHLLEQQCFTRPHTEPPERL